MRSHILAAVVALLASVGCGSASGGKRTPTTIPATTSPAASQLASTAPSAAALPATLPAALVGTWTKVFTTGDWAHAGGYPAGTWTMVVSRNGQVTISLPGKIITDFTRFEVTGSNLSIGGTPVCPASPARYRWSATPTALTIVLVSDTCTPRAVLFAETWQRQNK